MQRPGLKWALEQMQYVQQSALPSNYNGYKALSWTHAQVTAGKYFSDSQLIDISKQLSSTWNLPALGNSPSSAEIARVLLQQPFRAYYLGADLKT
jgi:hypothetical protein